MYTEINAALQSVKVISDWLNANRSLKNYNELLIAVTEVNSKLLSAQEKLSSCFDKQKSLSERVADLEKEIAEYKNFNEEIGRYKLHELKSGMLVYALQPEHANGDPMHYLCNNCVENGKLSKFQSVNGKYLFCQTCKARGFI